MLKLAGRSLFSLLLISWLPGCGGDDTPSDSATGAGSGGSGGGGGSGGSGGTAPNTLLPKDLFPLTVGSTWSYQLKVLNGNAYCVEDEIRDRSVAAAEPYDGKAAFRIENSVGGCDNRAEFYLALEGDEVLEWIDFWATALVAPVAPETTWITDGNSTFGWKDRGSVTVQAGTFSECWERTSSDPGEPSIVYCKGVGPVSESSAGYTAELLSYSVTQ